MEDSIDNSLWFAFRTKSRFEKKVHERLLNLGFNSFLPLITEYRIWSDRKKKVSVPIISSFVFVKCLNSEINNVLKVDGVATILKHLSKPAIVKDQEIENLQILVSGFKDTVIEKTEKLEKGTPIQVVKGPFKGIIGESIISKGNHRVLIELSILDKKLVVDIPLSFVEKL